MCLYSQMLERLRQEDCFGASKGNIVETPISKKEKKLGVVEQICNPSLQRQKHEDCKLGANPDNLTLETKYKHKRAEGMAQEAEYAWCSWLTPVILTTQEAEIRRMQVKASLGKKLRPYLKKTQTKKVWWSGLRGRAPA
jgi:hypothetical protein